VQPGRCFHLYTRRFAEQLPPENVPEMLRVALESLVLKILLLGERVRRTLDKAITPPGQLELGRTLDYLVEAGAVRCPPSGLVITDSYELSPLGVHLAKLPVRTRSNIARLADEFHELTRIHRSLGGCKNRKDHSVRRRVRMHRRHPDSSGWPVSSASFCDSLWQALRGTHARTRVFWHAHPHTIVGSERPQRFGSEVWNAKLRSSHHFAHLPRVGAETGGAAQKVVPDAFLVGLHAQADGNSRTRETRNARRECRWTRSGSLHSCCHR
jgi:hypothetical protein